MGAPARLDGAVHDRGARQILSPRRLLLLLGFQTPVVAQAEQDRLGGTLFLESGLRFDGIGFGAAGRTGRRGRLHDRDGRLPRIADRPLVPGQILTFTYPLIGNYGVPPAGARDRYGLPQLESEEVQVRGVLVRGTTRPNHVTSSRSLEHWLEQEGVPGIRGIDTRRLTEHLRAEGVVRGVIDVRPRDDRPGDDELRAAIRQAPAYGEERFMDEVAPKKATVITRDGGPLVAVLDCGIKMSILRALLDRGVSVLRLPYDHEVPTRWEGRRVAGLLVGNGPGDPAQLRSTIQEIGRPANRGRPTLGICLGHQLLALAHGERRSSSSTDTGGRTRRSASRTVAR